MAARVDVLCTDLLNLKKQELVDIIVHKKLPTSGVIGTATYNFMLKKFQCVLIDQSSVY